MADERHADAFLNAEDQATRLAGELESLKKTLTSYQASADALTAAARGLVTLATTQGEATTALNGLIAELRRLGIEQTQRRLDELATRVDRVGTSLAEVRQDGQARARALAVVQRIALAAAGAAVAGLGLLAWLVYSATR